MFKLNRVYYQEPILFKITKEFINQVRILFKINRYLYLVQILTEKV
jgi:hypothetical protein